MANPNPIVPHEAGKATQFGAGHDPRRCHPKLSTRFIAKKLEEAMADGRTPNDDILDHMIEVATKWEVIVKEHGDAPMPVASAGDSVKAAGLLWSYALGKPTTGGNIKPPSNLSGTALEMLTTAVRSRIASGEVGEGELQGLLSTLLNAERDKALIFIKAMGPRLHTLKSEQVDAAMKEYERDPQKFLGMNPPEPDKEGGPQL